MKKISHILIIFLLLIFVPCTKGQEVQRIMVYKDGNASYTAILNSSDSITFSKVTGVLVNGVLWAHCNVNTPGTFASQPYELGKFYQWNRRKGWASTGQYPGGTWDTSTPTGNTWEKVNDPCPRGWRAPTRAELDSLINSGSFWGELNGVSGRFFGNGDQKLFFPAAGLRQYNNGWLYYAGTHGAYWSWQAWVGTSSSYYMEFTSEYAYSPSQFRTTGMMVRCVAQ